MSNSTVMSYRLTTDNGNPVCHPELVSGSQTKRSRNKFGMTGDDMGMTVRPGLGNSGFTLLEVMVALLIIATSFVVLLHTRNQSVTAADYAKRTTVATLLASERMSEIEQEDFPDTGEDNSNFGDDYPEYRWKTSVSDTAYENIREVKVEVLWGEGSSERSIGLVNYVRKKE